MSKRPMYEPRICYVDGDKGKTLWNGKRGTGAGLFYPRRVRITDVRELTPEKAVERVLQTVWDVMDNESLVKAAAYDVGMTARVVNGKVRVRKINQTKETT